MEKLIIHILPNWINLPLKILLVIITISFATFIFATIKEKSKLGIVSQFILINSLLLSVVIICIVTIVGIMQDNSNSYTITKTNDTVIVTSHSDWIDNTAYNIIGHRDGHYYLENDQHPDNIIKLKDEEFKQITNQK